MRTSSRLALIGISICLLGITSTFVPQYYYAYHGNPDRVERFAFKSAAPRLPGCAATLQKIDRKVELDRSFNMIVDVSLDPSAAECEATLEVSAAAFDVKPDSVDCKLFKDSTQHTQRVYFNLLPKKAGTQQVVFTYRDDGGGESTTMEFTVYEYSHVPPSLSFWFPKIDYLFGGMLTVPWWYELFRKRIGGSVNKTTRRTGQNKRVEL
jgi:hypothetical protein